jgi:nucleotide-binding universal stress UspA family protein
MRLSPADEPDVIPLSAYRSILVPLDGSNFAEHAIPYAIGLAERSGAALKIVHVHLAFEAMDDFMPLRIDHATLHSLKRRKESYLNGVRRRISEVSSVRVSPYVVRGHEVSASLREVDLFQADLVIIATHARGPIGRKRVGNNDKVDGASSQGVEYRLALHFLRANCESFLLLPWNYLPLFVRFCFIDSRKR